MNTRFGEAEEIVRLYDAFEILRGKYCSPDLMIKVIQGKSDDEAIKRGVQEAMVDIKNWAAKLNGYYTLEPTKEWVRKCKLFFKEDGVLRTEIDWGTFQTKVTERRASES